jgi:hypothetical protein
MCRSPSFAVGGREASCGTGRIQYQISGGIVAEAVELVLNAGGSGTESFEVGLANDPRTVREVAPRIDTR